MDPEILIKARAKPNLYIYISFFLGLHFFFFFWERLSTQLKLDLKSQVKVQFDPSASAFQELGLRNALPLSTLKHINTTAPKPIYTEKQGYH